jgi:hypothetical protein
MTEIERLREAVTTPPDPEYLQRRTAGGWRLAGVVWERPTAAAEPGTVRRRAEVPFGMRVADDCLHLEEDPEEMEVLARMLRLIADDLSLSQVAGELNRAGFRTRSGGPWDQVSTFHLLPRLIEAAPEVRATAVFRQLAPAAARA